MPKKWLSLQDHCNPREIGLSIFRCTAPESLPPNLKHATAALLQHSSTAILERRTDRQLEKDEFGKDFVTGLFRSSAGWHRDGFSATCSWLGKSALVADKLWDIAAMLPEVGTVPYGRCCGRGGLSRCCFRIVALAEMEAASSRPKMA